ncbi:MAG: hypothetical protein HY784_11975, partial [Chloroflexi bacterium]|nr:hypothetical protein [Chloroflexota bacterium]
MAVLINTGYRRALASEIQGGMGLGGGLLADPPQWASLRNRYRLYWSLYDGSYWDERINRQRPAKNQPGDPPLRFPLQINPIMPACLMHAHALWGEVKMNSEPLMRIVAEPRQQNDHQRGIADRASEVIAAIAYENFLRTQQLEAGIVSQVLGGTVFKVSYDAQDSFLSVPIRVENILPDYFWATPRPGSQWWRLLSAKVGYVISVSDAKLYYSHVPGIEKLEGESAEYLEEWTEREYSIRLRSTGALRKNED